jgi:hypothetical protein
MIRLNFFWVMSLIDEAWHLLDGLPWPEWVEFQHFRFCQWAGGGFMTAHDKLVVTHDIVREAN